MGAYLKFIIPMIVVALSALAFQNCGNRLQANGDPYEIHSIQTDDPFLDTPGPTSGEPAASQGTRPDFTVETTCSAVVTGGQVYAVQLGKLNGKDGVLLLFADGRNKAFSWPADTSPLVLGSVVTSQLTVNQLSLSNSTLTVDMTYGSAAIQEKFNCQ